jgi:hypothetical protein
MPKPRVFIGSSGEARQTAQKLLKALRKQTKPVGWWEVGQFQPGDYTLESLLKACEKADFGVFVFAGDDPGKSRRREYRFPRDNVVFEYGLFVGALGRNRVFAILIDGRDKAAVKIPSDIVGINLPRIRKGNIQERAQAIENTAVQVLDGIRQQGLRPKGKKGREMPLEKILEAFLAAASKSLGTRRVKRAIVRGMVHALGKRKTSLIPKGNFCNGAWNDDWNVAFPCSAETQRCIRIVDSVRNAKIVKKDVTDVQRRQYPKNIKDRIKKDIASVIAGPILAPGGGGEVLGTVAFDSNLSLKEMGWNDQSVDEVLRSLAAGIAPLLQRET